MFEHRRIPPAPSEPHRGVSCILLLLLVGAIILGLVLATTGPRQKQRGEKVSQEIKGQEQNTKEGTSRDIPSLIILMLVGYVLGLITAMTLLAPRYHPWDNPPRI